MSEERLNALEARIEALELQNRPLGPRPDDPKERERLVDKIVTSAREKLNPPPVDYDARVLTDGSPVTADHREINEATGQQKGYVVLSAEERSKGFVRPVRRSYIHQRCGSVTTMGLAIAETYARAPSFYSGTFCCSCRAHYPIGETGEFVWEDGSKVGT